MTTYHNTSKSDLEPISKGEMTYAMARNQHTAHDLLLRAIKESGLTQKELSKLTGIDEATISRTLRRPTNFQINTLSKLLYAACGAYLTMSAAKPQDAQKKFWFQPSGQDTSSSMYFYSDEAKFSIQPTAHEDHSTVGAQNHNVELKKEVANA